jgi:3-hydroxybutyryl-CoA dehydrogenase
MKISEVGVIGSGVMGKQIAGFLSSNGLKVTLCSRNKPDMEEFSKYGDQAKQNIRITTELSDLSHCDLVVESVNEDVNSKRDIFQKLGSIAKKDAILVSNTSSIPISLIAEDCNNKQHIAGFHFSNPVKHMKLVEIIKADQTSENTMHSLESFAKAMGKDPIIVLDSPGFLLNRMLFIMLNEAANIFNEGISSKEDIDKAMVLGASHPIGPLKIMDLVGIDVTVDILKNLHKQFNDDRFKPSPILLSMLKEGMLGRKSKKGFYGYDK